VFMPLHFDSLGWVSADTTTFIDYLFSQEKRLTGDVSPERTHDDFSFSQRDSVPSRRWRELSTTIAVSTCTLGLFNLRHSSLSKSTAAMARAPHSRSVSLPLPTMPPPILQLPPHPPLLLPSTAIASLPLPRLPTYPPSHMYRLPNPGATPAPISSPRVHTRASNGVTIPNSRFANGDYIMDGDSTS
jgi:hypothetical protein